MQITPYQNGIHSIAEGLRSLDAFEKKPDDPYLMKDAIIRLHHGLETLLKDILFQRNPIFVISGADTVTKILSYYEDYYEEKNGYLLDNAKTIDPTEAIERIRKLHFGNISPQEYAQIASAFKQLNTDRNLLQHFAAKLHPERVYKTLGNLIPKTIKLIKSCYSNDNQSSVMHRVSHIPHTHIDGMSRAYFINIDEDLTNIYSGSLTSINNLQDRYDTLLNSAIKKLKNSNFLNLPLKISISDRGQAGPYVPELSFSGWMNTTLSVWANGINVPSSTPQTQPLPKYTAETTITKIDMPEATVDISEFQLVKIIITVKSCITEISQDQVFNIENGSEHISFIREPEVNFSLSIEIASLIQKNRSHFSLEHILNLTGSAQTTLHSSIFGDLPGTSSIQGTHNIELTPQNTSVELFAFGTSNHNLSENYSLKIKVDGFGDLHFTPPKVKK